MPTTTRLLRPLPALLILAACNVVTSYPTAILRPAEDAPERFLLDDGSPVAAAVGPAACRNPLRDPRGGEPIVLERSYQGSGDYHVANGRYGAGARELIRVDCTTGAPLGIVRG